MVESPENPFFSIVILCFRGGKQVIPLVEKLHGMLSLLNFSWEIILVGNYMPEDPHDETPEVVRDLEKTWPHIRAIAEPKKGMAGWDLRSGLNRARGKYIGFIDGDGQMPLESILACLFKIESESLDLVKTYRVHREDGVFRRWVSSIYNRLFRVLFNTKFKDINSNPKIILRSQYERMKLQSDDWFIDAEMMLRAQELGLRVGEVPMEFHALVGRDSFVKWGTIYEFLKNMGRYRFSKKHRIHHGASKLSDGKKI